MNWPTRMCLVAGVLGAVGCTGLTPCQNNSDCRGLGVCDAKLKICYLPEVVGGDGGVDASINSGEDAGTDAGVPTPCDKGCSAWQTCRPTSLAEGVCENARIRALSPKPNALLGALSSYTFSFEVTQWDGGMWPGDVPLSVDEGMVGPKPSLLTRKGVSFEAEVTLADRSGAQSVVAGWLAVDAGITVLAQKCDVNCRAWEECVPDASGGQCIDMHLTLSFTAPTENREFGPINSGQVLLNLTVTRADGGAFRSPVPFVLSKGGEVRADGVLEKSNGVWQATVDAGNDDGERSLSAGWDGGPTTIRTFTVTATPPAITLIPETAPVRPTNQTDTDGKARWKKSEVATVRLVSNRDFLSAPTAADFSNSATVSASATCREACVAPRCYCFSVDLAPQPLTQEAAGLLYGTVPVSLNKSLSDALGNSGSAAPAAFDVTRFKWSQNIASATAATPTAIALTASGVVIAGVTTTATVGANSTLTALHPDGGITWQAPFVSAAITVGPMVGQTGVYFALGAASSGVLRKLALDGTSPTDRCTVNNLGYVGDMALASPGSGEYPLAVVNDATLKGGTKATDSNCYASQPFWTTLEAGDRPTVVVEDGVSYVSLSSQPPIWKFDTLAAIPTAQGSRSTVSLFPSNLFLVGANVVGGGGGPTVGGVFSFYDTGGSLDGGTTVNATPGSTPGGAAVVGPPGAGDSRPRVYYGDSGGVFQQVRLSPENPPVLDGASSAEATGLNLKKAPVVGAGGHLYSAAPGRLYVFDTTPRAEWYWNVPGAPAEAIAAQLNLDKNRDAAHPCAAGQPGVLYAVTTAGAQTMLYAILVDSQGIDATAPWPRYQHDPANTGNPATSLSAWACP